MTGVAVALKHKTNAGGIGVALSNIVTLRETLTQTMRFLLASKLEYQPSGPLQAS